MSDAAVPAINALIWLAVKPIIKLALPTAIGFVLSRADLFPAAASRGASQVILNCTLPALLFSKIVPSITPQNAAAIGYADSFLLHLAFSTNPIFLIGFVYLGLSLLLGILVRVLLPTPRNFRWGLLAAATWSNWGDLPTSVVQTICAGAPFSGQADADLAVAYVAIFILVFYLTLFPMRGIHLVERDYTHPAKAKSDLEGGEATSAQSGALLSRLGGMVRRRGRKEEGVGESVDEKTAEELADKPVHSLRKMPSTASRPEPVPSFSPIHRTTTTRSIDSASVRQIAGAAHAAAPNSTPEHLSAASATAADSGTGVRRRGSLGRLQLRQAIAQRERLRTIVGSPEGSVIDDEELTEVGTAKTDGEMGSLRKGGAGRSNPATSPEPRPDEEDADKKDVQRILLSLKGFLLSLATPPTIALVMALVCALVNRLKALFTVVDDYSWHPTAPDGDPPLAIILDTATFVGNASVPLGLLVLGSALARMRIPRPISKLPLASIAALAAAKLVILPVFGYFFVTALAKHTSLTDQDDRVLQFTAVFFSCVPTATTQVALTQIFAPESGEGSNSDVLASYLIFQYVVFVFSSVILTAITLSHIF